MKKIKDAIKPFLKKEVPDIRPGDTVKVFQKIPALIATRKATAGKEKSKERVQVFEGVVIARKHNKEIGATITVRRMVSGIGVERIFPLHLPTIKKIEIVKRSKTRRAKLYYLRKAKGRRARLKRKEFTKAIVEEKPKEAPAEEKPKEVPVETIKEEEIKKEGTKEEPQGEQDKTKKNSKK